MSRMPDATRRLLAGTRGQVIALLRRGSRTVNDLAAALRITDNAVRAQLLSLERDGLVQQAGTRPGTRKPHFAYELTSQAEELFRNAYAPVLSQLLAAVGEQMPEEKRHELLHKAGQRLAAAYLPRFQGQDRATRIRLALELLGELGGLAELDGREGKQFIRGYSCPLGGIVPEHPEACQMAEALLSELIGSPVHECCQKGSTPRCCFQIDE